MCTVPYMPLNFEEIKKRRSKVYTMQEAADRASRFLKAVGHKPMTVQRWSDLESGRYADPGFLSIEAMCFALECSVDAIRTPVPAKLLEQKAVRK
jgi:hypothetical protein